MIKLNEIRMPLDMMMTVLSIILMGGTVLFPDDKIHQILGMTLLVLWAVHIVLNRMVRGIISREIFCTQNHANCGKYGDIALRTFSDDEQSYDGVVYSAGSRG